MTRTLLLAGVAALAAGTANAQLVEIEATRTTPANDPIVAQVGQTISSHISEADQYWPAPARSYELMHLQGKAGQTVSLRLRSDIPTISMSLGADFGLRKTVFQPGPGQPITYVLPKDGRYWIIVEAKGPQRFGAYQLSIGDGTSAPSFAPTPPAPVQIAQAPPPPQPAPAPAEAPAPAVLPKLQLPDGITVMDFGQTLSRPAGAKTELYGVIGEAGAVLTAAVTGTGVLGVTIFTPEGGEMLTSGGQGAATLKAVLPKDAVYIFAVTRTDPSRPYKLSLSAESPNLFQWGQRRDVGYEVIDARGALVLWTCWVEPEVSLRYLYADGANLIETLNSAGSGSIERQGSKETFTTRRDGETLVRTMSSGREVRESLASPPRRLGAYRGYRCP